MYLCFRIEGALFSPEKCPYSRDHHERGTSAHGLCFWVYFDAKRFRVGTWHGAGRKGKGEACWGLGSKVWHDR